MFNSLKIIFMKKFKLSVSFIFCFFVFGIQNVFSGDIPLKKDDPSIQPNGFARLSTSSLSTKTTFIPVNAEVIGNELIVDFTTAVGTAYVSVVDLSGNVVYQTVVDTFSTQELVIPVDGLSTGKYILRISYGTTKLSGSFQL